MIPWCHIRQRKEHPPPSVPSLFPHIFCIDVQWLLCCLMPCTTSWHEREQGNSQNPGAEKLTWTHWIISCLSICLSRSWVLPLPQSLMTEQKPSIDFSRGQKTCSFSKSLFNTRIVPGIKSEGVVPVEQLSPMDWQWINLPRPVIEWDLTQADALRDPWCSSQQFILLTEKETFGKMICGKDCFTLSLFNDPEEKGFSRRGSAPSVCWNSILNIHWCIWSLWKVLGW